MTASAFLKLSAFGSRGGLDRVERVSSCRLDVSAATWDYARDNRDEIERHWQRRSAESPAMFNGAIYLMHAGSREGECFAGTFLRTDFKSYLYWREMGFPQAGAIDGFGSSLIRSAEGYVVLGRQRTGNVNAGIAYLPGGFIDPRDVTGDGAIDIDGSILRELSEETGLERGRFEMAPGYILTHCGALLSIAREVRVALPAVELRAEILAHLAGDPQSELIDAVIVRSADEIEGAAIHPYARQLLGWLFAAKR